MLFLTLPIAAFILYYATISVIDKIINNKDYSKPRLLGALLFAYIILVSVGLLAS